MTKNKEEKDLHLPRKIKDAKKPKVEKKWFEKEITADCFIKRSDKKGKYYAQHKEWKQNIWIGAYDTEKELDKVLKDYITSSKKPPMARLIVKNLHSILMDEKDFN